MRILFLLVVNSLFSAASFTHLFIAEQFLKYSAPVTESQERDFYLGNVFPDIQYLGGVGRDQTHEFGLSMQDVLQSPTSFKAGSRLHSFVDEQRENLVLKWKIYDLLEEIEPRNQPSFLKLIESEILYDQTDPLRFVSYFQEIIEEELLTGISLATHQKSHDFVVEHLYNRPSKLFQELAKENRHFLRFSAETVTLWSRLIPEYAQQKNFQNYVRDFIAFFNSEFAKQPLHIGNHVETPHVQVIGNSEDDGLISAEKQSIVSALKDLEELGYCVIPNVISRAETELLYQRVWHEYIEKAWPQCKLSDRSNWRESFPIQNKLGVFCGPAGQTQVMWDLRQNPKIVDIFAQIWNTNDLIVSMDGMSIMCPPEIREEYFRPWPHVDQGTNKRQDGVRHNNLPPVDFFSESSLNTRPFTIQGQFLFEDSFDGDGGFFCIPKSHLRFEEFSPTFEALEILDAPWSEKSKIRDDFLRVFFAKSGDDASDTYPMKHVTAPRGSLILWDSRTIHWNQHPLKNRPFCEYPKIRMVGYLCYVPKKRMSDQARTLRIQAFETGVSTGHNPAQFDLKFTKDHIWEGYEQYFEDSSYTQPLIHLTSLGESLLGR